MSKAMMRADTARLVDAYLLKGGVVTMVAADHRSRPRAKMYRGAGHRPIPMWQRVAIINRANWR